MPEGGQPKQRRSAKVIAPEVAAKIEAKLTVELSTADLEELGQSGEIVQARGGADRKVDDKGGVIISAPTPAPQSGPSSSVFVDLGDDAPAPKAQPARAPPRTTGPQRISDVKLPKRASSGRALVVFVYLVSVAALGLAIYERYFSS